MRTICIAADDFGLHAGINAAVLQLAAMGRIQAIGCMVGAPAWATGAAALRALDPDRIDLGLHLDLCDHPMQAPPRRLGALITASLLRRLDCQALRAEIRAQLDAFEQALGRPPAFIDGHRHVHQLPMVRQELLDELARRHDSPRPWLRCTRQPRRGPALGWREAAKAALIEHLGGPGLASLARRRGYPMNQHLLGVYGFHGGPAHYLGLLAAWLDAASHADLLMCHPSLGLACADPLIEARAAEFQMLSGMEFGTRLDKAQVQTQPMSRILARSGVQPVKTR